MFVCLLWGKETWLMNAVGNLCEEDMVNKYNRENAGVTRDCNYSEIKNGKKIHKSRVMVEIFLRQQNVFTLCTVANLLLPEILSYLQSLRNLLNLLS